MNRLNPTTGEERDVLLMEAELEHLEARFRRRQRLYFAAIGALAIAGVTLAGLNLRLASRVSELETTSPMAVPAEPAAAVPSPEPTVNEPLAASPQPGVSEPVATQRDLGASERAAGGAGAGVRESIPAPRATAPVASLDTSERVARWMVATYGKSGAERQVEAALQFYPRDDERSRYWRRVLGHVRSRNL
jgi:hypothetical protein